MKRAAIIPMAALLLAACHDEVTEPEVAPFISAPRQAIVVGPEIPISTGAGVQSWPAVSGNLIAWDDTRDVQPDVYMCEWDDTTCEDQIIPTEDVLAHRPRLSGNRLLWTDKVAGKKRLYMCEWDGGSCPAVEVPIGENAIPAFPVASGNVFVWADSRSGGGDFDIYACEWVGTTCPEVRLAGSGYPETYPDIDGNLIVWMDEHNGNPDIYACEWSGGACDTVSIATNPYDDTYPAVSGNRIVWEDRVGGIDIYMCEWSAGGCSTPIPISTHPSTQQQPDIWGNLIAWMDSRNGVLDIYVCEWNGSSCPETRVTSGDWRQMYPAISDNRVVWQDQRQDDGDIYMVELGGATPSGCGQTITESMTLTQDIGPCAGDGIIIGADGITLDGDGHWIRGQGSGTGVVVNGHTGATVAHVFAADFATGMAIEGGSGNTVLENQIRDNSVALALTSTTGTEVLRNVIADNAEGVAVSGSDNGFYQNIMWNKPSQLTDTGDNDWSGNYWSNYWGEDTDGDGYGDTDVPHEGVDNSPLVDQGVLGPDKNYMCDDWWLVGVSLVWRGGWSPVKIEVKDPHGRRLSKSVNEMGKDGFYYEAIDPSTGSKLVHAMVMPCTKPETPGGPYTGDGVYKFEMTALEELDYKVEWYAATESGKRKRQSLTEVLMRENEKHVLATNLKQVGDGKLAQSFAQGVCGQTVIEDVTLTEDLTNCEGYGIIVGEDNVKLEGEGHIISGKGSGKGVLLNRTEKAKVEHVMVSAFKKAVEERLGKENVVKESQVRESEVGIALSGTGGTTVTQNVVADNTVGVKTASSGNGVYHNFIFGNETQIDDAGGNSWVGDDELGNYWSGYWGQDTNGDDVGDTDVPHLGVDEKPLLDPSILTKTGAMVCDDWWCLSVSLVWRGGWSPVKLKVTDHLGRKLTATENEMLREGYYYEELDPVTESKRAHVVVWPCTKHHSGDGVYTFEMEGLEELTYSMEWFASKEGEKLQRQSLEHVKLKKGEKHKLATNLVETLTESPKVEFKQGTCGQTITESVTLTQDLTDCEGYGVIIGKDEVILEGNEKKITGIGGGRGVLFNKVKESKVKRLVVSDFEKGIENDAGGNNTISENQIRKNEIGVRLTSTGAEVIRNIITENEKGIATTSPGNAVYHNVLFNNETQVEDVGGNSWFDPVKGGNYWSDYWGEDTGDDFIGDTRLPHLGLDAKPLLDPSIPERDGDYLCADWWYFYRGGWSPVTVQLVGPNGGILSSEQNTIGPHAFYAEDEQNVPGSKLVQALVHKPCPGTSGEGEYSLQMTAEADLTYWLGSYVSERGDVLLKQYVEGIPLLAEETRAVEVLLKETATGIDAHLLVDIDIKPGDDPMNCIKADSKGRLPVAIVATPDFDPSQIDPETVLLEGVSPLRWSLNKDVTGDGVADLVLHYATQELPDEVWIEGGTLTLTGALLNGSLIQGSDVIYLAGGPTCGDQLP